MREMLPELKPVRDLIYYDGPLLSEYEDAQGRPWLFYWCDRTPEHNRWLVLPVSHAALCEYRGGRRTLLQVLQAVAEPVFLVDIDSTLNRSVVAVRPIEEIDPAFLPSQQSWYDESLSGCAEAMSERQTLAATLWTALSARANEAGRLSRVGGAPLLTATSPREAVVAWLQWNDPNGIHLDEMAQREGFSPHTEETAWAALEEMLDA